MRAYTSLRDVRLLCRREGRENPNGSGQRGEIGMTDREKEAVEDGAFWAGVRAAVPEIEARVESGNEREIELLLDADVVAYYERQAPGRPAARMAAVLTAYVSALPDA
ncbi:hypothetical protein [uncultured Jannaschia sp.]|uniref:hypothetical protein n=1 Tax=uncultured Jannaschia sp. TaxID=293347 RepID=UPI0026140F9E|nr:hypothetical protein [uncultured Jannaschia sp.]